MYQIDHVVVLMLENRSFDCMLGRLRPNSDDFDGVPPGAANIANGVSYRYVELQREKFPSAVGVPDDLDRELQFRRLLAGHAHDDA